MGARGQGEDRRTDTSTFYSGGSLLPAPGCKKKVLVNEFIGADASSGQAGGVGGEVQGVGGGRMGGGGIRGEGVESLQAKGKRDGVPEGETETWHRPDGCRAAAGTGGGEHGKVSPAHILLPCLILPHNSVSVNVSLMQPDLRHRCCFVLIGCCHQFVVA